MTPRQDEERQLRDFFASPAGARLLEQEPSLKRLLGDDPTRPGSATEAIRSVLDDRPTSRLRRALENSPSHQLQRALGQVGLTTPVVFGTVVGHGKTSPAGPRSVREPADLGRLVREARKSMKLSQQRFADLANVGRRFVSELEAGKASLEFGKVLMVCKAAGIDILATRR